MTVKKLGVYFIILNVSFHEVNAIFGFIIMITMVFQLISGLMLSLSLVTDPMLVPVIRDEEDIEDLYTDDFFWLHERGVDLIFIFSYFHLFRKLYIHSYDYEHESTWKSGVFSFLLFQVVVFFGLALCCTHLSEITLTIAANIMHTFFFFYGKFYWWLFTDKQLCADTLVRIAYLHYVIAAYLSYASFVHTVDMHYDWKNETTMDGMAANLTWWDETFLNELSLAKDLVIFLFCLNWMIICDPEALTYENFMWGDIGLVTDVRFYGVAPHWYFRPFMAWLIICPHHKTGIFGLLLFFFLLLFQPLLHGSNEQNEYYKKSFTFLAKKADSNSYWSNSYVLPENNMYTMFSFYFFVMSCLYTTTYLPYGRFYNRINGNYSSQMHFMYIFSYLQFSFFRKPFTLESKKADLFNKSRIFWR